MPQRKIRVMVAKPGWMVMTAAPVFWPVVSAMPDLKLFIRAVIKQPEQIAAAAIQEDVDLVGLSCLSGAHRALFPRVVEILREKDAGRYYCYRRRNHSRTGFSALYDAGIKAIFTPGASLDSIVEWIRTNVKPSSYKYF